MLEFVEALRKLRPHLSQRSAWTLALTEYKPDVDPATAARDYHKRMQPEPAAAPAKKRRK